MQLYMCSVAETKALCMRERWPVEADAINLLLLDLGVKHDQLGEGNLSASSDAMMSLMFAKEWPCLPGNHF